MFGQYGLSPWQAAALVALLGLLAILFTAGLLGATYPARTVALDEVGVHLSYGRRSVMIPWGDVPRRLCVVRPSRPIPRDPVPLCPRLCVKGRILRLFLFPPEFVEDFRLAARTAGLVEGAVHFSALATLTLRLRDLTPVVGWEGPQSLA
jgi:hypothetical protein